MESEVVAVVKGLLGEMKFHRVEMPRFYTPLGKAARRIDAWKDGRLMQDTMKRK